MKGRRTGGSVARAGGAKEKARRARERAGRLGIVEQSSSAVTPAGCPALTVSSYTQPL